MRWNSQKHTQEEAETTFTITDGSERSHKNLSLLKKSMGLYPDNIKINYCEKERARLIAAKAKAPPK